MPILKIEKLTKKYGKTYALNGLDMEVKKGDIYGFVGPNGAGKTTTLRIISGLLKSDGGDLWLDGVRTTKNILKQKSLIGFVPDFFGVYENLSVIEYLEFFAASYGIYGRAGTVRAREVLEMVELSGKEEQMVDSLSRGIQQRLCLARAMIHKPKLLVLDEPNSGLDPRSRKDFQLSPAAIGAGGLYDSDQLPYSFGISRSVHQHRCHQRRCHGTAGKAGKHYACDRQLQSAAHHCAEPGAKGAGTIAAGSAGQPPFCG